MKSFCVLLFALVVFVSAADDDTDQEQNEVPKCADKEVCKLLVGDAMCNFGTAGVRQYTQTP